MRPYITAYVQARHWTRSSKSNILGGDADGCGSVRFANNWTEIRFASRQTYVLYFVSLTFFLYHKMQFSVHSVPKDSPQRTRDFRKTSQKRSFMHNIFFLDNQIDSFIRRGIPLCLNTNVNKEGCKLTAQTKLRL